MKWRNSFNIFTCRRLFEVYFRFGIVENDFAVAGRTVADTVDESISSDGDVSHLDIRKLSSKSSDWLWLVLNDNDLANELLKYWHDAGDLVGDTWVLVGENSELSLFGNCTSPFSRTFSIFATQLLCLRKLRTQTQELYHYWVGKTVWYFTWTWISMRNGNVWLF